MFWVIGVVAILLLFYLGLGLSIFILPRPIKQYYLFFAPWIGFIYLVCIGWFCYWAGLKGSDSYAWWLMLPPFIILISSILWKRYEFKEIFKVKKELVLLGVITVIAYTFLSLPFFKHGLTSLSLGNNDPAAITCVATFLKQFSRLSREGLLVLTSAFRDQADITIFGGPYFNAFFASILNFQTYQLQTLSLVIFFSLSIFLVYILARQIFCYDLWPALGVSLIYAFNPIMLYLIFNGFQGQIIGVGLVLGICLSYFSFLDQKARSWGEMVQYFVLGTVFSLGLYLTYNHILPFVYALILFVCSWFLINRRVTLPSASKIFGFLIVALIFLFVFSPFRMNAMYSAFMLRANQKAGWFIPWLTPDMFFGVFSNNTVLRPHHKLLVRLLLSIPFIGFILAGWILNRTKNLHIYNMSIALIVFIGFGYLGLCFLGRNNIEWGGYKSFKWISHFLPLIIVATFIAFREANLASRNAKYILLGSLILLSANLYSSVAYIQGAWNTRQIVSPAMDKLSKVDAMDFVKSVNILGDNWWDILWSTNFLIHKRLFFETTTYDGRDKSELLGEYTLVRRGHETQEQKIATPIFINEEFILIPARHLTPQ